MTWCTCGQASKTSRGIDSKHLESLQDLVDGNYLQEIPTDPLTHKKDWVPHFSTVRLGNGGAPFGIDDVHSSSEHADG